MELNEKIQTAIRDNLPNAVAGELKAFIETANTTARNYKDLELLYNDMKKDYDRLQKLELKEKDLAAKEKKLAEENATLALKTQLLELREKHATERVAEIRNLTETVFKSNRMNYNLDIGIPVAPGKDQWGNSTYPETHYVTGKVEKED